MERRYHLHERPIPEGFQIFEERLPVSGIGFRKSEAASFAKASDSWLEWEREPGNTHDSNAIKIIGCSKGWFGTKHRFIGYVPKEVAEKVVYARLFHRMRPRLLKTYVGDQGFVEVLFQLLGPRSDIDSYRMDRPRNMQPYRKPRTKIA